jgi:fucose 4-O-acetylase-like acetyltransferase
LVVGFLLLSDWSRRNEFKSIALAGAGGIVLIELGLWLDARSVQLYAVHDFWHTSPNFFLVRVGIVLVILFASYLWCRWGAGEWGFSPLIELGKSSLVVYWVHIEFVYGGLSILPKRSETIGTATLGLALIFAAMTLLAATRNRFLGRKAEILALFRRAAST